MTLDEFVLSWSAFAARWDDARGESPEAAQALLDDVLASGLSPAPESAAPAPDPVLLECEVALIKRAKAFDVKAYKRAQALVRQAQTGPFRHFCSTGWKQLISPRIDFDLWWYWNEHLDPTREDINPLVHHLVAGRHEGLPTLPPVHDVRPPTSFAPGETIRRACLFVGYDPDGIVDDHVVAYVTELSRHADVYYLADSTMAPGELEKLAGVTRGAWAIRHGRYDFGSWSMLAQDLVGWDSLSTYDEVVFANDSAYLLRPLDEVFARMDATAADWWGLHATKRPYSRDNGDDVPLPLAEAKQRWRVPNEIDPVDHLHLSSYFLVFRRPVIADPGFRARLDSVRRQTSKPLVILKYEVGISRYLLLKGFDFATIVEGLYPYLPAYTTDYWEVVAQGFPLLKRNLISENPRRMPGLDTWKERVLALVPDADVESFERNLLRVSADDQLRHSLSITTRPDGTVDYHEPWSWARFRTEDRWAPKFDHWWAFPVCAYDHTLSGNERALFDEIADDPSIKKIILTRSRRIDLPGENVVTVPLMSREGQYHLARARQIFVKHGPRINAHWPLSPITHNFVNTWHGIPLKRFGSAMIDPPPELKRAEGREHVACRAVVTSSRMDSLTMRSAFWPLAYTDMWPTGLPRNDYIRCEPERLPPDLAEAGRRLESDLDGRRLVLFLPTFKDAQDEAYYRFSPEELAWLQDWMYRNDAVLGVREHMADSAKTYWHQLAPLGAIDVSSRRYPDLEVLYRSAAALVSDYSSCLVDFMLTGRPVASFAYDLDRYSQQERGLFYDLHQVLPGPVCETFDDLAEALDGFFDPLSPEQEEDYAWRRRLFFDHVDDRAAARVVARVKSLYGS
ncbi:CDP-glycerol glycerophosphotransferase family protein [Aeromicrobium duanguangcaii]|uniref:CDP-glycerol glycerophosphotransferase family protein n=1 Tax=Aeromicrobium duanguangcaii TaxID=2968086 RepID=UPI002017EEF4|nr:CDP-glycerol glycerophosphotransferase family protein [Aeromicrobium duanguangcaii]